ncbi:hypothetical protein PAMP_018646 [Pampus punctatissimus]
MPSSWTLQCFQNQKLFLQLLTMIVAVTGLFSVTENKAQIQLRGEVGQNVTFRCPFDKHRMINFFYLQRDEIFVNGFYKSKNKTVAIWENTRLDKKTNVIMYRLNISHDGDYQCLIQYSDSKNVDENHIHLSVTANYTKPTVTMSCDPRCCRVTCASQGGYPLTKMMWNVGTTGSQMWKIWNSSEETDPVTKLVSSYSTADFNCSYGVQKFLSCSVGDVTSDVFSVCVPPVSPKTGNPIVTITAICAMVVVSFMVVLVVLWRYRKGRQTGAAAGDVKLEEVIGLNDYGRKEAS